MISGVFILLFFAIIPIAIISIIISAISRRNKSTNDEKDQMDFEKIIRSIYVYLLLICLLCSMIGGVIYLFSSTVDYFLPEKATSTYEQGYPERERNVAIVGMFTASSILLATTPLFIYHNKIAKSESTRKK